MPAELVQPYRRRCSGCARISSRSLLVQPTVTRRATCRCPPPRRPTPSPPRSSTAPSASARQRHPEEASAMSTATAAADTTATPRLRARVKAAVASWWPSACTRSPRGRAPPPPSPYIEKSTVGSSSSATSPPPLPTTLPSPVPLFSVNPSRREQHQRKGEENRHREEMGGGG